MDSDSRRDRGTAANQYGIRLSASVAVACLAVFFGELPAAQAWDFSTSGCIDSKTQTISNAQPQAFLSLDASGSMGSGSGSKWEVAKSSIDSAVNDMTTSSPDTAEFGFGYFRGSGDHKVDCKEDAHPDINSALYPSSGDYSGGAPGGGGTHIARAIDDAITSLANSGSTSRLQASVIITDGQSDDTMLDGIRSACDHKSQRGRVYMVGFGSGTDVQANDILAAAGGSGACCDSSVSKSSCSTSHSKYKDLCAMSDSSLGSANYGRDFTCKGSFQVSNGTDLKNALNTIAGGLACSIDVSSWGGKWKDSHYDCQPEYDCFDVTIPGLSKRVYHMNSSQTPKGWEWVDPSQQDYIRLTNGACVDAKSTSSQEVDVTRACMCSNGPGQCSYSGAATCECTKGDWSCNQGIDSCAQRSQSSCASSNLKGTGQYCELGKGVCLDKGSTFCNGSWNLKCSASPKTGNMTTETCGDGKDNDCDGATDESASGSCTVSGKKGRCSVGTKGCSSGTVVCNQDFAPMPEICNGLDDDCNGVVDDIKTSWSSTSWGFSLTKQQKDRACGKIHQCVCKSGDADTKHRGNKSAATDEDEFDSMTSNTMTSCYCSE